MKRLQKSYLYVTAFAASFLLFFLSSFSVHAEEAQVLDAAISISDGSDGAVLTDQSVSSKLTLTSGTQISIQAASEISGIYLIWDKPPAGWTLQAGTDTSIYGEHGFLHEYAALKNPSAALTVTISEGEGILCDVTILSAGSLPSDIQVWEPPCEKADLMLLSTHADDEHLFFGGTMPYYAGERGLSVQVVYFCSHAASEPYREHEKLNGLWLEGVKNYPVMGSFPDEYSTSLEEAMTQYNYDDAVSFISTQLRRFKPLVALGQDLNGEYGHGAHRLTAKALTDAVQLSGSSDYQPASAAQYGVWDTPKTYLHLYPENRIRMDWNIPLTHFGGRTALQMADAGYKAHESQQWCWFYVSDSYKYSCAEFGLFRSLVGHDAVGGDFMENITPYEQQTDTSAVTEEETESVSETALPSDSSNATIPSPVQESGSQISESAQDENIAAKFFDAAAEKIPGSLAFIIVIAAVVLIIVIIITVQKRKR